MIAGRDGPGGTTTERRARGQTASRLAWITLTLLAFVAGMAVAGLWSPSPVGRMPDDVTDLATSVPLPATEAPIATPSAVPESLSGQLPSLYIEIAPDELAKIVAKRDEALETWILQADDADFVDAQVQLDQDLPIPVALRLKGDWGDHFTGHKWSYRVETRGDAAVLGMRVFSLQDPSTRAYLNEWLFTEALQAEDVLSVRYAFVRGVQNGEPLGIYAVEEGFDKELLESQGRREGVIIRYDEDLLWAYWAANENDLSTPRGVNRFHIIDEFGSGDVDADPLLAAQRDVAIGKLRAWWVGDLAFAKVFDADVTARFWALVDVWGAQHALQWHNLRYYYNPVTTLLEPIGFDAQPLAAGSLVDAETLPGRLAVLAIDDVNVQRLYTQYLWRYTDPAYLSEVRTALEGRFEQLRGALSPEFGEQTTATGESVLAPPWETLATRQHALRELLTPFQMTYAYRPTQSPAETPWLDVGNLTGFPVEVLGIETPDGYLPASPDWVAADDRARVVAGDQASGDLVLRPLPTDATHMPYVRLIVSPEAAALQDTATIAPVTSVEGEGVAGEILSLLPMVPIKLVTRLWGMTQTVTQPVLSAYPLPTEGPLPTAPTLEDALSRHPMLQISEDDTRLLTLPTGTWTFSVPLVLPDGYGLALEPGTRLTFQEGTFLLSRGPLRFLGTETEPIHLGPSEQTWSGIITLGSDRPSYWQHVIVADTDAVALPGWTLTGGITFYESPVALDHVSILGTMAEDAINVIRSEFVFESSVFADTFSDAFDADFSQGEVVDCGFTAIGADAIDTSGSQVTIERVRMVGMGDKGVSAGEASRLSATGLTIEATGYGIVSKDLSEVMVQDATIAGARVAALAAYTKKPSYGPAAMTVTGLVLEDVPDDAVALVQTGSWIDLDGERIWGVDVDVDALYTD